LISVGNVQYQQGEYDQAAASYRRAADLLVKAFDLVTASMARSGLGRVLTAQGDFASALDVYGTVLTEMRARRQDSNIAATLESIGEIHFRLGNVNEARASFDEARKLCDGIKDLESAGRLLGDIGLTEIVASRYEAALAAYVESRKRYETAGQPDGVGRAWIGIGYSHAAGEAFENAIAAYAKAIAIFAPTERKDDEARARLGLSLAYSGAEKHEPALEEARRVVTLADGIRNVELQWRGAARVGEAQRALKHLDLAERAFLDAITVIERLVVDAPTSADARTQLGDSGSAWAGLAFTRADRGDAPGALLAAEQRRAHMLRLIVAPYEREVSRGMPTAERDEERRLTLALVSLRAQVRAEGMMPHPDKARLQKLGDQLDALVSERDRYLQGLFARRPDLQLWRGLRAVSSASVYESVTAAPELLAIEYIVTDRELLVLTAGRDPDDTPRVDAVVVKAKRRDLVEKITLALEPVSLHERDEWRTRTIPLSTALLAPVTRHLPNRRRIIIVPDDILWKLPFEALPVGSTDLFASGVVSYASSLVAAAERPALATVTGATIVADPEIPELTKSQVTAIVPGWKASDREALRASAKSIADVYRDEAKVVEGRDAGAAAAESSWSGARVLHVAAPFQANGAAPLFSSVLLAAPPDANAGPSADGRWDVRAWFERESEGSVLVLPGTAESSSTGIDAVMTALDWASAAAGSGALLTTRQPADGFAPDAVVLAFHRGVANGAMVLDAYRAAIAAARAKDGAAPASWAGLRLLAGSR
jgi:tetratricopeptide (TPR) repeat protein